MRTVETVVLLVASGERQTLETFLELYRDILKRKLTGLSDQQIRQRHVPSATTLGGLAKHLAAVEREWFQVVLARRSAEELDAPLPDDSWTLASDDTAEKLLAGYERACAASRQVAAGFLLDDPFRTRGWDRSRCDGSMST